VGCLFETVKMQQTKAVRTFPYRYPFCFSLVEKIVFEWVVGIFLVPLHLQKSTITKISCELRNNWLTPNVVS
jgi:hypothetical protein